MERFRAGAVVAGTSAGAAIMPPVMIAGGASADALANGTVHGDAAGDDGPEGVLLEPGMGFYQGAVVDQHFLARGRIGRLLVAAVAGTEGGVGLGIDENTAVVVDGARARVVGASGVILVDARSAQDTGTGQGAREVPVHLLGAGDGLDLETLRVTAAPGKEPVTVTNGEVSAPDDLFASWAFLHLLDDLAASEVDSTSVSASGYRITVAKAPGFQARSFQSEGVEGTPYGLSAGPFLVSLTPED